MPQNLPAGGEARFKDEDMVDDEFLPEELEQARAAGSDAVGKATAGADKEAVLCQAYDLKLSGIKRARLGVRRANAKATESRG